MPLTPENVESYPVTPLIEPVPDEIVVRLGGVDILRTVWGLRVIKRGQAPTYYLPLEDLRADLLALPGEGMCAWCAQAYYWTLRAAGVTAECAAWDHPEARGRYRSLRGHIALSALAMESCRVGGMSALPQPGGRYGGWVTPNLRGRIEGAPGPQTW